MDSKYQTVYPDFDLLGCRLLSCCIPSSLEHHHIEFTLFSGYACENPPSELTFLEGSANFLLRSEPEFKA